MKKISLLWESRYMPLFVGLIALSLFLPGRMSLPPLDRDEARYMQATSQMVSSHDYMDIHYRHDVRYLQPAGTYWLEALSLNIVGSEHARSVWPYRIPSLIAMVASMVFTALIGRRLFSSLAGFLGALLLMSSVLITAESRMATTDSCLLLAVLISQWVLAENLWCFEHHEEMSWQKILTFWVALGGGLLIKGPVILLSTLAPLIIYCAVKRDWRLLSRLYPSIGWVIPVIIILPWSIAIGRLTHGSFFHHALMGNFFGKMTQVQEGHKGFPGFYAGIFLVSFWPGSDFFVASIPAIMKRWRDPVISYLLCWVVVPWLVLEMIPTKLPHYVMPIYPAIAILTAAMLVKGKEAFMLPTRNKLLLSFITFYGMLWAGVSLLLAASGFLALRILQNSFSTTILAISFVVVVLFAIALWQACWHHFLRACAASIIGACLLYTTLFIGVIPSLNVLWISPRLAALVQHHQRCAQTHLYSLSYAEPSFVFLMGGHVSLLGERNLLADLTQDPKCTLVLADRQDDKALQELFARYHIPFTRRGSVTGLNYSKGRFMHIILYGPS